MSFNIFLEDDSNATKVRKMCEYMEKEGLVFTSKNFSCITPYAIMENKTSIGYRHDSKQGETGIVFYCAKDQVDKNALSSKLGLKVYENSEKARPYSIFIPENQFEEAVSILKNTVGR